MCKSSEACSDRESITVTVFVGEQDVYSTELTSRLVFGRQRLSDPPPYTRVAGKSGDLVVIAGVGEVGLSRKIVSLELMSGDRFRVTNLSPVNTIRVEDAEELASHASCESTVPATIVLSDSRRKLRVEATGPPDTGLSCLSHPTKVLTDSDEPSPLASVLDTGHRTVKTRLLVRWLRNCMGVFQSAASSPDFFAKAAKAVIDIVGLDHAAVLAWRDGNWVVDARSTATSGGDDSSWAPSRSILGRVRADKRTYWKVPSGKHELADNASVMRLEAYVASPILDRNGEVIGAVYGDRVVDPSTVGTGTITELEAMLVDLLSSSVAAGMARLEQERAALQARVLFEQFFTTELSQQLESDPALLSGRDAEVSVLFCDIRGFSRISQRIGANLTFDWINEVMGALSDCVIDHDGVLVDYIADALVAMWGAPVESSSHAKNACQAAVDMLAKLPGLNDRWAEMLGEPMTFTIGINTGMARVGNSGSARKFKYGPLGNTVNLASRVQGTTKYVRAPLVITEATAKCAGEEFPKRRLCSVEVVNIAEPVMLYELCGDPKEDWSILKQRYESALKLFEQGDFREAVHILAHLLSDFPEDGPSVLLLSRAVDMLAQEPEHFTPVWKLEGK